MTSTVSVLIANYNRSDLLLKAVKSVLMQSYPVLEILVCDDGSTDDSRSKIMALNDPKVRWIDCGKNGRPAIPRNKGIAESKGEWIAILDNDDEWLPEKIAFQLNAAEKQNAIAVCSNAIRLKDGVRSDYFSKGSFIVELKELLKENFVICSSIIFHRSLMMKVIGFPEQKELRALEDYALWLRISSVGKIVFLADKLVLYNDSPSESIRKENSDVYSQRLLVMADFKRWAEKMNPSVLGEIKTAFRSVKIGRIKFKFKNLFS